jgi:hypothetical protein
MVEAALKKSQQLLGVAYHHIEIKHLELTTMLKTHNRAKSGQTLFLSRSNYPNRTGEALDESPTQESVAGGNTALWWQ